MRFSTFLIEEKNTHMTHLEDKVLYGGVDGTRQAINALRSMRDMLAGNASGSVSVKWDGAPAVFAGIDPSDGRFFVAKKGIFNKNPKVYKTAADIDADTSGDLNAKLQLALKHLPKLGITNVVQGDFLYARDDLTYDEIDGQTMLTFHPNTIVYAVPADSDVAKEILRSEIGIVWHTTYVGDSFETMKAQYGVDVGSFRKSPAVWSQDAMIHDATGVLLNKRETAHVNTRLSQIGKIFNQISSSVLRAIEQHPSLAQHIETFNNSYVRRGEIIRHPHKHVDNLIKWIHDKYEQEAAKRSTPKGKDTQYTKRESLLSFFSDANKANLRLIFELQKLMVEAKLILIRSLNRLNRTRTFVKTQDGYRVTGAEGFVAIDKTTGGAVKLVDRLEFSYNNFNPDILKGWMRV